MQLSARRYLDLPSVWVHVFYVNTLQLILFFTQYVLGRCFKGFPLARKRASHWTNMLLVADRKCLSSASVREVTSDSYQIKIIPLHFIIVTLFKNFNALNREACSTCEKLTSEFCSQLFTNLVLLWINFSKCTRASFRLHSCSIEMANTSSLHPPPPPAPTQGPLRIQ
jgi:hypothetical protein